jgi:transposase InsO family protein
LRQSKPLAHAINEIWSMDCVADALFDGRRLRMLTVVDLYTRECLAIEVGQSLKGKDGVAVLNVIERQRGSPRSIKTDNGSEFIGKAMDRWAYERAVELDFSRPGKPTDNAAVESFSGRLRWTGPHQPNSPADAACRQHRRSPRSRRFLLLDGTETGPASIARRDWKSLTLCSFQPSGTP